MQLNAEVVYNNEQKICSQRALRLKTGKNDFGQSRSLKQLTGKTTRNYFRAICIRKSTHVRSHQDKFLFLIYYDKKIYDFCNTHFRR